MSVMIEQAEADATATTPQAGGAVLIVDDSAVSRSQVGGLIRGGTGRAVLYADGGTAALEILSRVQPEVVITDLQMPGMDGLELVQRIRVEHPEIPVILMTAYGSETIALQALNAGAASYVPKKSLTRELVDTLHQVLTIVEGRQRRQRLLACRQRSCQGFAIENDPEMLSPLVASVQEDLVAFGIGDATARTRIGVALQESLANALFHGNLECSSDLRQEDERRFYDLARRRRGEDPYGARLIHFESTIDRNAARFVIQDEGPGFDVARLDKPFDPEDLMRIGGRGMLLIRTFMDEVRHNRTGNEITLVKWR